MTVDDKRMIIDTLTAILQDNVGQKITVAMANGLLLQLEQEMQRSIEIESKE